MCRRGDCCLWPLNQQRIGCNACDLQSQPYTEQVRVVCNSELGSTKPRACLAIAQDLPAPVKHQAWRVCQAAGSPLGQTEKQQTEATHTQPLLLLSGRIRWQLACADDTASVMAKHCASADAHRHARSAMRTRNKRQQSNRLHNIKCCCCAVAALRRLWAATSSPAVLPSAA
jgi:hypothetical protein